MSLQLLKYIWKIWISKKIINWEYNSSKGAERSFAKVLKRSVLPNTSKLEGNGESERVVQQSWLRENRKHHCDSAQGSFSSSKP